MRVLIVCAAILLAGCASVDPEPLVDVDPIVTPEPVPEPQVPANNTVPTAFLSASDVQGQAPFNTTFTIGGDDADGDSLQWTLDVDSDGSIDAQGDQFPAQATASYPAGEHVALLTVSDGFHETTASLTITAEGDA